MKHWAAEWDKCSTEHCSDTWRGHSRWARSRKQTTTSHTMANSSKYQVWVRRKSPASFPSTCWRVRARGFQVQEATCPCITNPILCAGKQQWVFTYHPSFRKPRMNASTGSCVLNVKVCCKSLVSIALLQHRKIPTALRVMQCKNKLNYSCLFVTGFFFLCLVLPFIRDSPLRSSPEEPIQ